MNTGALGRHLEHRLDESLAHLLVSGPGKVHAIERNIRIGQIEQFAEVDVTDASIAAVAALEHRGQLGLLLEMALPEVLTDAVRLCGDDHLSAMLQGKINGDESRPAVLLPW